MSWRIGLFLLILLLVALFAAQNSGNVMITFLNSQTEAPLSIVILLAFVTGMVSIGVISAWQQFVLGRRLRHQQALTRQLEKELNIFRQKGEPPAASRHGADDNQEIPTGRNEVQDFSE